MSSRKSTGEGLPSSKNGERTPLRSLDNEMLHLSTPSSRRKSSADTVKTIKDEVPLYECSPEAAWGLGDVSFKSFICPGGEVEILGSSVCAEQSIILPYDQDTSITATEDTVISDSMIVESCSDHTEHPYYYVEMLDASSVDAEAAAASFYEVDNTALASGSLEDEDATHDSVVSPNECSGERDARDGGEVEAADVTRQHDETIPLPQAQLDESSQDDSLNSSNVSDCGQLCQVDPPNSSSVHGVPVTPTVFETKGTKLSDVTFKSFNCSGGEIELLDGTNLINETIPLPTVTSTLSYSDSMNQSILAGDYDVQNDNDHLDHPYCCDESSSSTSIGNLSTAKEPLSCSTNEIDEVKQSSVVAADSKTEGEEDAAFGSVFKVVEGVEPSNGTSLSEKTISLSDHHAVICQPLDDNTALASVSQDQIQADYELLNCPEGNDDVVLDHPPVFHTSSLINTSLNQLDNESNCQFQETSKHSIQPEDSALPSMLQQTESSDCNKSVASAEGPTPVEVQQHLEIVSQVHSKSGAPEPSEAKDSALGSSENGHALYNSAEQLHADNIPGILKALSQCPSLASALKFGILSPVVRRISTCNTRTDRALDNYLAEDSVLDGEKSLMAPVIGDPSGLWAEHLQSPMSRPLFNSTVLGCNTQSGPVPEPEKGASVNSCAIPQSEAERLEYPFIADGPLQQQLRQMAEFLMFASGKMGPAGVSASALPPAAATVPSARTAPAESHSICVGTTAVELVDHSINTSGQFERKREFTVADSCTLTDPLLWNLPPGSLECFPREELEQRLRSSMIMVEALVQQLTAARAQTCSSAGPAPSELREKLVQTDHTELSQTSMYRDLYMEALSRIGDLELDGSSLQSLIQWMQGTRVTMASLTSDTDAALSNMKEIEYEVREDHQSLTVHYGNMKALLENTKETQTRMMQKLKDALHQRNEMRTKMEDAFTAKEAAFSAMEQLRTHCGTEMSELQKSLGSQHQLLAALNEAYPEQVALNQAYSETLSSASNLLSETMEEQSSLIQELCTVRGFLQKTAPMLLKLNDKAAAALRERDEHCSARDQAVEEREQIEEELNQTKWNLQTAREEIGDLNLQLTILSSEMGVLRQKLTERDEERGQLERKVTEMSATVSSTLASHTFLEQALASETTKLQQSWKDIQQATDKANELETSLDQSEERVSELSQALAQSEGQLDQLQTLSQSQKLQIQQLQDVCTQLGGVREMNEFLQMENELAREQVVESERLLRANLQALRERNIQCEDLKTEHSQLQLENRSLQEQLETTASRASATQLELGEKLAQAVTEITLLHHTLRGVTNELHAALNDKKSEAQGHKEFQPLQPSERRHPSSSFVDSIMVALTNEKEEDGKSETLPEPDVPEPHDEALFSEKSAFIRISAFTPKKGLRAVVEFEPEEDDQSSVAELLADLGSTVTELISALKLVQGRKDAELEELHNTIFGLQEEQQAANSKHITEVSELQHQLSRLNILVERGNQALQQKAQDDKTLTTLAVEIQDVQEILNKHKTDNNELRKEVVELRRSLQQSKVESQFLREELRKAGGASANPAHFMEEKIQLLKEVERLKLSLQEVEQAKVKLLERAKRHQMIHQNNQQKSENELQMLSKLISKVRETLLSLPEVVKNCEQLQQLVEYIG
ncbi:sperm-associated antigen 5 [Pleuronectes platessa]|uniref:sperm-associated antigen 5 n=1 Tax=Pleuronectes platessa TaxID=8262 RepID=UPI00232A63B7|nr:sperm-associated antigen 5 [Pleuronectes platessa]XP_053275222.1 sperm-associated antigen 5 [Pleuronectes platessa]